MIYDFPIVFDAQAGINPPVLTKKSERAIDLNMYSLFANYLVDTRILIITTSDSKNKYSAFYKHMKGMLGETFSVVKLFYLDRFVKFHDTDPFDSARELIKHIGSFDTVLVLNDNKLDGVLHMALSCFRDWIDNLADDYHIFFSDVKFINQKVEKKNAKTPVAAINLKKVAVETKKLSAEDKIIQSILNTIKEDEVVDNDNDEHVFPSIKLEMSNDDDYRSRNSESLNPYSAYYPK